MGCKKCTMRAQGAQWGKGTQERFLIEWWERIKILFKLGCCNSEVARRCKEGARGHKRAFFKRVVGKIRIIV